MKTDSWKHESSPHYDFYKVDSFGKLGMLLSYRRSGSLPKVIDLCARQSTFFLSMNVISDTYSCEIYVIIES